MFGVNFPKLAFNSAAVFGIWFLYTKIGNTVAATTIKLLKEPFVDKDAEEKRRKKNTRRDEKTRREEKDRRRRIDI